MSCFDEPAILRYALTHSVVAVVKAGAATVIKAEGIGIIFESLEVDGLYLHQVTVRERGNQGGTTGNPSRP